MKSKIANLAIIAVLGAAVLGSCGKKSNSSEVQRAIDSIVKVAGTEKSNFDTSAVYNAEYKIGHENKEMKARISYDKWSQTLRYNANETHVLAEVRYDGNIQGNKKLEITVMRNYEKIDASEARAFAVNLIPSICDEISKQQEEKIKKNLEGALNDLRPGVEASQSPSKSRQ